MDKIVNAIYCPDEQLGKFRELWAEDICSHRNLYLSEYAYKGCFRAFMDIDVKVSQSKERGAWSKQLLSNLIRVIQAVVADNFHHLDELDQKIPLEKKRLMLIVLHRRRLQKIKSNGEKFWSFGYHLHWPNLIIDVKTATELRSCVLRKLDNSDLHAPSGTHWEDIVDENVWIDSRGPHIRGPLCHKCEACDCGANNIHCNHMVGVRMVGGSVYKYIFGVFDAKCVIDKNLIEFILSN